MLNKLDYVKKFELVVKQEIQNYQDSLHNILKSIRDLKLDYKNLQNDSLENHALLHSLQTNANIEIENLKKTHAEFIQKIDSKIHDMHRKNVEDCHLSSKLEIVVDKLVKKHEFLESKIAELFKELDKLNISILIHKKSVEENNQILLRQVKDSLERNKKEIIESPSKLESIKNEIETKLNSHIVDVAGVSKELLMYGKDNFIMQKKIENLYTLIERLKK